jgi:hypothetical protein
VGLRTLALAVWRVAEEHCGRFGAGGGTIITNVRPQPSLLGGTATGTEHRDRGVIAMELLGGDHVAAERGH